MCVCVCLLSVQQDDDDDDEDDHSFLSSALPSFMTIFKYYVLFSYMLEIKA